MNVTSVLIVFTLYLIAYVYSLEVAPRLAKCHGGMGASMNDVHESCFLASDYMKDYSDSPLRGKSYYIGVGDEKNAAVKRCAVTFWGASHYVLYFLLGLLVPDAFWETFIIGVAFEVYEYHKFDCHDAIDIALNSLGFVTGAAIREVYNGTKN